MNNFICKVHRRGSCCYAGALALGYNTISRMRSWTSFPVTMSNLLTQYPGCRGSGCGWSFSSDYNTTSNQVIKTAAAILHWNETTGMTSLVFGANTMITGIDAINLALNEDGRIVSYIWGWGCWYPTCGAEIHFSWLSNWRCRSRKFYDDNAVLTTP